MTKRIHIGSLFTEVDDADYEFLLYFPWRIIQGRSTQYAAVMSGALEGMKMHMLVSNFKETDHIDGNGLNNQRSNLRNGVDNDKNRLSHKTYRGVSTASKFKGVSRHRNKWKAAITVDKNRLHLGSHETEEEAAKAYDKAARKYFGNKGRYNFPEPGEQSAL